MSIPFAMYLTVLGFEYYGIVRLFPFWNALSLSLIISAGLFVYVLSKTDANFFLKETQTKLLLCFLLLTMVSPLHAIVRLYSINVLKVQLGYFLLFVVSTYFVSDARRSRIFAWLLVTVHAVLVIENADRLFDTVRFGSYQASYFMGDGNDFAWSLNVVLPLSIYLFSTSTFIVSRLASLGGAVVLIIGIMGTSSRGAAIAMASGFLYFILMSKRKFVTLSLAAMFAIAVFILAPGSYFDRMQTIGTYSEDTSAMGRLEAWGSALKMAIDYPLGVGAGNFNTAYGRFYRSDDFHSKRWISAHSIYFSVLGEYGFSGVILLLAIILLNAMQNQRSIANLRNVGGDLKGELWPTCINMSIVAFSVGGIFLGGVNYPHIYILTALTMGAKWIADESQCIERGGPVQLCAAR